MTSHRFDIRLKADETESDSETQTLVGSYKSRVGSLPCSNSATSVQNEIYKCDTYSLDSDENSSGDDEESDGSAEIPSARIMRKARIESPETVQKRKEAYEKWKKTANERLKERKRLENERRESEVKAKQAHELERKERSEKSICDWMRKKQNEAEKKIVELAEKKKAARVLREKPKEFKKSINYEDWIAKKNEIIRATKKAQEEKHKVPQPNRRDSELSRDKWIQRSLTRAKPVQIGRGLESLRGSTTKINANPEPWNFSVDL